MYVLHVLLSTSSFVDVSAGRERPKKKKKKKKKQRIDRKKKRTKIMDNNEKKRKKKKKKKKKRKRSILDEPHKADNNPLPRKKKEKKKQNADRCWRRSSVPASLPTYHISYYIPMYICCPSLKSRYIYILNQGSWRDYPFVVLCRGSRAQRVYIYIRIHTHMYPWHY